MSWQQALQNKGCKTKSQGTKEDNLSKRQALVPKRDKEAPAAGGAMNVEKTGKGGLPADSKHPDRASEQGGSCGVQDIPASAPHLASGGWLRQTLSTFTDTERNRETPACLSQIQGQCRLSPASPSCHQPCPVIRGLGQQGLGLNFPTFCLFPAPVKSRAQVAASQTPRPAERPGSLPSSLGLWGSKAPWTGIGFSSL